MTQPITPATEQTHDIAHPGEPESAKTTEKQPKYLQKTLEAIKLVDNGADPTTALQITNGKANITRYAVDKFKAKYKKYSLANPSTVKSAHNQIKRILSGEAREIEQQKVTKDGQVVNYTEVIAPSDTNILAAASLVYDRYEPVVKQAATINIDISAINLDDYRNKLACGLQSNSAPNPQVIDVTQDK